MSEHAGRWIKEVIAILRKNRAPSFNISLTSHISLTANLSNKHLNDHASI